MRDRTEPRHKRRQLRPRLINLQAVAASFDLIVPTMDLNYGSKPHLVSEMMGCFRRPYMPVCERSSHFF